MSVGTGIEWTEATWNPVTGCDRVSAGCDHCYAATLAKRLKAMGNPRYQKDGRPETSGPGFGVTLHHDQIDLPLRWKKPKVVFVNSMSDLFHDMVSESFVAAVFDVMAEASQHTFQVLTKRPRRMQGMLERWLANGNEIDGHWTPAPNVWLGTSVEDQKWADQRIPLLLEAPAAVRFLSCEPLLGSIDLRLDPETAKALHWVIAGGESGPGYRPMQLEWARSLRDQCRKTRVPFFFKQWGGRTPKAGGRELDGEIWDEMPTRSALPAITVAG